MTPNPPTNSIVPGIYQTFILEKYLRVIWLSLFSVKVFVLI